MIWIVIRGEVRPFGSTCGAAGGDVAGGAQSDNGLEQADRGERNRIGVADAEELRLKQVREGQGEHHAHDEARQCESKSLAKNETVDASPSLRRGRHADADFSRVRWRVL